MQRSHNVNSYIWKAEVQSNGRIHFHITINKFIHWKSIRAKWNRLLAAHGYCKVFQDGTNDKGNSATQIKAVKNEKQITSYMCNYLAKSDWLKYEYDKSKLRHVRVLNEPIVYNDEFYSQQNFHTIHCTDGTYSTYKRFIEGRHWGASNNLNTTAALISEKGNIYQYMHHALSPEIFKFIQSKNCQVFIPHNKKFTRWLPDDLRDMISTKVKEMRKMDVIQTKVTVDSLFD
jgi:protein-arginine kinase activator protein McsA